MPDTPSPVDTATKAVLGTLARGALKIAGTALVTRGLIDQGTVDGAIPMATEELVGAAMVGIGQGWGLIRAWWSHTRWAAAQGVTIVSPPAQAFSGGYQPTGGKPAAPPTGGSGVKLGG